MDDKIIDKEVQTRNLICLQTLRLLFCFRIPDIARVVGCKRKVAQDIYDGKYYDHGFFVELEKKMPELIGKHKRSNWFYLDSEIKYDSKRM